VKGSCLCGSIEVVAPDHEQVGLCHCSMCRRWSGGPMFAVHCGGNVKFSGAVPVTYRSSEWAERELAARTCSITSCLVTNTFFRPVCSRIDSSR
jgi:hypothetical protein